MHRGASFTDALQAVVAALPPRRPHMRRALEDIGYPVLGDDVLWARDILRAPLRSPTLCALFTPTSRRDWAREVVAHWPGRRG